MTSKRKNQQNTKPKATAAKEAQVEKEEQSTETKPEVAPVTDHGGSKETAISQSEGSEGSTVETPITEAPVETSTAVNAPAPNEAPLEVSVATHEPVLMGKGEATVAGGVDKEDEDFGNTNLSALMPTTLREVPTLFDALRAYERDGGKVSGANQTQLMASQVRLLNALTGAMNTPDIDIRKINSEIIAYFKRNLDDAFSMRLAYRNLESIALTAPQRELYQSLITLYRTAADRGRVVAGQEVDLPRVRDNIKTAYPRLERAASILPELFK